MSLYLFSLLVRLSFTNYLEYWRVGKSEGELPAPPHDETGHTWHHSDILLLDFSTQERVNAKFHSDGLTRREVDIIYRILLKNGDPIYLYLLPEFQSRVDPWMAVRVGTYVLR